MGVRLCLILRKTAQRPRDFHVRRDPKLVALRKRDTFPILIIHVE